MIDFFVILLSQNLTCRNGDLLLQKRYYRLMHQYWKTVAKYTGELTEEEVVFLNSIADLHNEK